MTPAEVIEPVLEILERPDLESMAYTRFNSALKSAHSIERLRQDLRTGYILNPSAVNEVVTFLKEDTAPRSREIYSIDLYQNFTEPTPGNVIVLDADLITIPRPYVNVVDRIAAKDYYGYKYMHTYTLLGAIGRISGIEQGVKAIGVTYLSFPTFTRNLITSEYESDSWILTEFHEIVAAFLRQHLSTVIDSDSIKTDALREVAFQRQEFIKTYVKDILPL